ALWQLTAACPFRRTMQGDFFKRDLDRLVSDPLLSAPPADNRADLPDPALLTVAWAQAEGIVEQDQADLRAGALPTTWDQGLADVLAGLWATLPLVESWNPQNGWTAGARSTNPYSSADLLAVLLLAQLPPEGWAHPEDIEAWIKEHHPFWQAVSLHTLPE